MIHHHVSTESIRWHITILIIRSVWGTEKKNLKSVSITDIIASHHDEDNIFECDNFRTSCDCNLIVSVMKIIVLWQFMWKTCPGNLLSDINVSLEMPLLNNNTKYSMYGQNLNPCCMAQRPKFTYVCLTFHMSQVAMSSTGTNANSSSGCDVLNTVVFDRLFD